MFFYTIQIISFQKYHLPFHLFYDVKVQSQVFFIYLLLLSILHQNVAYVVSYYPSLLFDDLTLDDLILDDLTLDDLVLDDLVLDDLFLDDLIFMFLSVIKLLVFRQQQVPHLFSLSSQNVLVQQLHVLSKINLNNNIYCFFRMINCFMSNSLMRRRFLFSNVLWRSTLLSYLIISLFLSCTTV